MRKLFVLVFLIAVIPVLTHAQRFTDLRAGFHLGYNSYRMAEFKSFEKASVSAIQHLVPMKTMQNYPNRGSLGASLNFTYRETENGIKYTYHSSGSRHHYGDYSGEIGLDAIMTSHAISGETSFAFDSSHRIWSLFMGITGTNHFGTYRIEEFVGAEQTMIRNSIKFRFHALTMEPFVKLHREFGRHIALAKVGFDLHILSTVYYKDEPVSFTSSNKKAKAEMSGFRAEIGYQIRLGSRLK